MKTNMNNQAISINPIRMFNPFRIFSGILYFFKESRYEELYVGGKEDAFKNTIPGGELGIVENNEPQSSVFTDPVNEITVISLQTGQNIAGLNLYVYSSLGSRQFVDFEHVKGSASPALSFSSSHLLPGVYYYVVMNGGIKSTGSFVVAR